MATTTNTKDRIDRIRSQFEYYFSPHNLPYDEYLKKQMNGERYVALSILKGFAKVKEIDPTDEEIVEALTQPESEVVEFNADKTMIRAKLLTKTVLSIRNLPEDFSIELIQAKIDQEAQLKGGVVKIQFDKPNFNVTFTDEKLAFTAFQFLSTQQLNEQTVSCFLRTPSVTITPSPTQREKEQRYKEALRQSKKQQQQKREERQQNKQKKEQAAKEAAAAKDEKVAKYDRKILAEIVENLKGIEYPAPASFYKDENKEVPVAPVIVKERHTKTTLLHPIPVMFPASPSPEMAMKAPEVLPPFLSLNAPTQLPLAAPTTALPDLGAFQPLTSSAFSTSLTFSTSVAPTTTTTTTAAPATTTPAVPESAVNAPVFVPSSTQPPAPKKQKAKKAAAPAAEKKTDDNKQAPAKKAATAKKQGAKKTEQKKGGEQQQQQQKKNTQKKNNANNKDAATPAKDDKTITKGELKKRAALAKDKTAFPSLGAPAVPVTTTTTKLNFANTIAKSPDPEKLAKQQQLLAERQKKNKPAVPETDAVAEPEIAITPAAPEAKEQQPKAKKPKAKKEKKTKPVDTEAPKVDVAIPIAVTPAPAGSWAARAKKDASPVAAKVEEPKADVAAPEVKVEEAAAVTTQ